MTSLHMGCLLLGGLLAGCAAGESDPQPDAGNPAFARDAGVDERRYAALKPTPDAGSMRDTGINDASEPGTDAGASDGGGPDAGAAPCVDRLPPWDAPPALLSETGLYAETASRTLAPDMRPFTPRYELWSDGAEKARYLYLPRCAEPIDTRVLDDWSFPVGTRAFKEFSFDGEPLETRFIYRYGPGRDDFMFAHYRWNEARTDAELITADTDPSLMKGPEGSGYRIPAPDTCTTCHGAFGGPEGGLPSRYLGLSAVQLGHEGSGLRLSDLSGEGLLSHPPTGNPTVFPSPQAQEALGYLHANCAHCHNETIYGVHFPLSPLSFQLSARDRDAASSAAYLTAVGVPPLSSTAACSLRVAPGSTPTEAGDDPSCVTLRMATREGIAQMPPLATHRVDEAGLALIRAWIEQL